MQPYHMGQPVVASVAQPYHMAAPQASYFHYPIPFAPDNNTPSSPDLKKKEKKGTSGNSQRTIKSFFTSNKGKK